MLHRGRGFHPTLIDRNRVVGSRIVIAAVASGVFHWLANLRVVSAVPLGPASATQVIIWLGPLVIDTAVTKLVPTGRGLKVVRSYPLRILLLSWVRGLHLAISLIVTGLREVDGANAVVLGAWVASAVPMGPAFTTQAFPIVSGVLGRFALLIGAVPETVVAMGRGSDVLVNFVNLQVASAVPLGPASTT